jgi:ribose-phosphate pyrophosphokinase
MEKEDVVILADPKGACYNFARRVYDKIRNENRKDFPLDFVDLSILEHGNKEEKIQISDTVRKKSCFFIHDSNKHPAVWFMELAFVNEALKNASAKEIVDVLPDLKFSRQDRKDEARVALNAKVVADIASLYADRVMTVDVHSLQIQGFYSIPFDPLYSFPDVVEHLYNHHRDHLENIVIMSPDLGGSPRAKSFKNRLAAKGVTTDFAMGYKERPKPGEVSKEYIVLGDVEGKNILMVDDILDGGGTFITAADTLKKFGAKNVWAYATHGLFTKGVEIVTSALDKVLVSDTNYVAPHKKVEIIPLANMVGEAIFRNVKGYALSDMYKK